MIKQVKIKILTLDPTGVGVENFEVPIIISEEGSITCPHCNMTTTTEPMKKIDICWRLVNINILL